MIGRVERIGGSATVQHSNGVTEELKIGDNILKGDIVETRDGSALGLSFIDGTAFNMGASARMSISELVYDANGTSNTAVFSLVKGAISFVAGQAAKTGDMRVETPVATMGIRGTTVSADLVTDVNNQLVTASFSLVPDHNGLKGAFDLVDGAGTILATITSTDLTFTLTPTANGIAIAMATKTLDVLAKELAAVQVLFPIFLANPANATNAPPDVTPQAPSDHGSSTPNGGNTQALPSTDTLKKIITTIDTIQNPDKPGEKIVEYKVEIPPAVKLLPSVFAEVPANLVEAVIKLNDSGNATSVSHILKADLDGSVTYDLSTWQSVGNGIYSKLGSYGAASLNTGTGNAADFAAQGSGWTNLGNGIFEKEVFFSGSGTTETIRVSVEPDTLTYALGNVKADPLGPENHPTESFVIDVVDNDSQHATTTIIYTIDGRNDPPDLSPDDGSPHNTNEIPNTTASGGTETLSGSLAFSDPELNQHHTLGNVVSEIVWSAANGHAVPAATQTALAAALHAELIQDSVGTGTGAVSWDFAIADDLVDFLREGETLTITYNVITVRDDLDASSSQPVTIIITGTNDRPAVAADGSGPHTWNELAGTGNATPAALNGTLNFTDVDFNDTHTASATLLAGGAIWSAGTGIPQASLNAFGLAMQATIATGTASDSAHTGSGSLSWNFNVADGFLDFLAAGETLTLTYAIAVADDSGALNGSQTQNVSVTINGTNDAPVAVSDGPYTASENTLLAINTANGVLTNDTDVDTPHANLNTVVVTGPANAQSFSLNPDGSFSYLANVNFTGQDSFTYHANDGVLNSNDITVLINVVSGTNTPAVIGGTDTGSVTEDVTLSASGLLTVSDVDAGQSTFQSQTNTAGTYGSFSLDVAGHWSYSLNNAVAVVQSLRVTDHPIDTFQVLSADGTTHNIQVTIHGTNDVPVIGGVSIGAVTEDVAVSGGNLSTSGALTIADVDAGQSNFTVQAATAGSNGFGSFTLDAAGHWTYTANDAQTAIQQLGAGQSITDSFTAVASDGTANQLVTVTIHGTNDVPVIGGVSIGAVTEDVAVSGGNLSTSGALTIADVDAGQSNFTVQAATAGSNGFGSFTLDAAGHWTYTANDAQTAIQQLGAGQSITDSFTAVASDGTANQLVTVTIHGTNDAPVAVSDGPYTASENTLLAINTANGVLTNDTDVDTPHANLNTVVVTGPANAQSFSLNPDGSFSYLANVNFTGQDSFTYHANDGSLNSNDITVLINVAAVANTPAVIAGVDTGTVQEDVNLTATGLLTIVDPDPGESSFQAALGLLGTHGTLNINAAGNWTYHLNNADPVVQALPPSGSTIDDVIVHSFDGTTHNIQVTIHGTNDVPVIGGVSIGAVTEDVAVSGGNLSTSGALTIADVDAGQSNFTVQAATAGSNGFGSFTLDAAGHWTYTANDAQTAIQQLGAGQSITDSFTAVASDGTANQLVTVTIHGTNDVPVIGGVSIGAVTEDVAVSGGNLSTSGALTIADVDAGQSNFTVQAATAGSNGFGSFTLDAAGHWTYTANDAQTAIQQLGAGQSITDSFTAVASDGTANQLVTVTIHGTNDVPVIGGVSIGAVTEDVAVSGGNLSTSGALTIADVDAGQSNFTVQAATAGSNGFGSFTLDAAGHWTYTANDAQTAIQQLGAGQSITDSFTAVASDGTANQLVTVTIHGTNDVPVIGGVSIGAVTEDVAVSGGNLSTSGALTIADVDAGQSNFTVQAATAGSNGFGSFTLDAAGHWTYTANDAQTAIQQLGAGQSITDSFTAVASDGTANQLVTVTIHGTNDAPVISTAETVTRISVPSPVPAGAHTDALDALVPAMSSDGRYVAFASLNGLPDFNNDDDGMHGDVYLYDRVSGATKALADTVHYPGAHAGEDFANLVSISGDGRFTVFTGQWRGPDFQLGPDGNPSLDQDGNPILSFHSEALIYDRVLDTTSVLRTNEESPTISRNGNIAAMEDHSGNDHGRGHILVTNRSGTVLDDLVGNDPNYVPLPNTFDPNVQNVQSLHTAALSADGRYVTFWTKAPELVVNGTQHLALEPNGNAQVYIYDRVAHTAELVSRVAGSSNGAGQPGNGNSGSLTITIQSNGSEEARDDWPSAIAGGGRFVAFASNASDLVGGDTNGATDIFVYDRNTHTTQRVSVGGTAGSEIQADGDSIRPSLSPDGRYVIFSSSADNLVAGDNNGQPDTFIFDRQTHSIERLTAADGTQGNGDSSWGESVGFGGLFAAFGSTANNLVANDANSAFTDVFLVDHSGGHNGVVQEDFIFSASNHLTATDRDAGDTQSWTIVGASAPFAPTYHVAIDRFTVTKNASVLFTDDFADGNPPPSAPGGSQTYISSGGALTEANGRAVMDAANAVAQASSLVPGDPFAGQFVTLRTDTDSGNTVDGLKSGSSFSVSGMFDLSALPENRDAYGIRLSDRQYDNAGVPIDRTGDDVVVLQVSRGTDGVTRVSLSENDFVHGVSTFIQSFNLNPAGHDQILLTLNS